MGAKEDFAIPKRQPSDTQPVSLTFIFDNEEMAYHFKSWLCGCGEQQYWEWMDYRQQEEPESTIAVSRFDYWKGAVVPTEAKVPEPKKLRCGNEHHDENCSSDVECY
jgi:hypothetical protein